MNFWFLLLVLLMSLLLTGLLRRYAISRKLIDVPNARSSHSVPTPRGGGVAIVVSFLGALFIAWASNWADMLIAMALLGSGALTALIGFMDDHGHIAARWRLLGHFGAAAWSLYWLGGTPSLQIMGFILEHGYVGAVLGAFYLVWMLNLYNFMDGIDGLAAGEVVCVCLGASLIYTIFGFAPLIWAPIVLAMAALGFLFWNFPPARIFMGDAGSGFLGIILGVLSLHAAWTDSRLFWVWAILLGVFIVDATLTLFRRLIRGEKVYEAHRSHAYQFASRRYGKHLPVTIAAFLINIFWLLPIAFCMMHFQLDGLAMTLVAYAPLVWLGVRFNAGQAE
ncbi:MraY family glycosyltransferase [Pseudomonas cedrina]|uniref:MraY family glycosyltransferase n=1 Tax=Pseudomonas cedrina TaxID=651740 RepID=UPI002782F0D3|nr:glycosyltransferase family 4 protein [Pseudomonas cedrina]MDQ0649986.1 Fuc2NAc and GlcNAc transferase [Pseudomonas cedrina]